MDKFNKAMVIAILFLLATTGWESYIVLAIPAPTISRIVTPGDLGPCDYFIYLDGTTPVALFESHKGGSPGDNLAGTPGQDIATFLNPLTTANAEICLSGQTFSIGSTWVLAQSVTILGNFNSTVLQATANNFDMVGIVHPGVGGTTIRNMIISGLTFTSNGHTGLVGINLNQSLNEVSSNNIVQQLWYNGAFTYLAIMDGNEAAPFRDVYCGNTCTGEISFKVFNGASEMINVQYMNPQGTGNRIHLLASQFLIDQSTIDGIMFETQFGGQNGGAASNQFTAGDIMISNTFFANNDPGGMCRLVVHTGELVSVLSLTLMNDQIMLNNNGCLFASYLSSGSKLSLNYVSITGSYFFNTAGTGYWAETNSSGTLTMKQYHWDPSNRVTPGIALTGGLASQLTTGVCASFYFAPEPTGFNGPLQNYPAVPVGTGSANARQNCLPYPLTFFMNVTSSAGVVLQTGGHIIDVLSSNTDKAIYNTPTFTLYPGDKIYFATNVPYAWIPYGDQW